MSERKVIKKYVVLVRSKTEGGDDRNFRSVPMSHAEAMSEIADLGRDGIKAWPEEASADDMKPLAIAKQRLKERKQRKKENDAHRLLLLRPAYGDDARLRRHPRSTMRQVRCVRDAHQPQAAGARMTRAERAARPSVAVAAQRRNVRIRHQQRTSGLCGVGSCRRPALAGKRSCDQCSRRGQYLCGRCDRRGHNAQTCKERAL